jgi:hypothetical protein
LFWLKPLGCRVNFQITKQRQVLEDFEHLVRALETQVRQAIFDHSLPVFETYSDQVSRQGTMLEYLGISVANLLENKLLVTKKVLLEPVKWMLELKSRHCNARNETKPGCWEQVALKKENQTINTVIQENRRMYSKKDHIKSTGIKNDQTNSPARYQRTFTRVTSSHSRSNSVLDKLYCKYSHQIARTQSRSSFTPGEETRLGSNSRR